MEGRRVVVTGGQGFIGQHVVRLLDQAGARVVVPYRPDHLSASQLPATLVPLDLRDAAALDGMLAEGDLLVHLAAQSGGIQFQEKPAADVYTENQIITRGVLESARRARVQRMFLASSAVVYRGSPNRRLLPESAEIVAPHRDQVSAYAWSKLSDEVLASWFASADAFEIVTGRFTSIYGPGGSFDPSRSAVVHSLVRKAVEAGHDGRVTVWGSGRAVRSFLHVHDAARAVVDILVRGAGGEVYNVDSSEPISIGELAALVRDTVDPDLELVFDASRPEGIAHRVLDTRKLRELGFTPTIPLQVGVKATVEAYRAGTRDPSFRRDHKT
jgi:GDP-L-fucose synthase